MNRNERKEFTQRTQIFEFLSFILCVLSEKTLRHCGKKVLLI